MTSIYPNILSYNGYFGSSHTCRSYSHFHAYLQCLQISTRAAYALRPRMARVRLGVPNTVVLAWPR